MTEHKWVSEYETCDSCNYANHRCHFCGSDLDHEGWDTDGNDHTVAFCRPDLAEHEEGPLCTHPAYTDPKYAYLNEENGYPWCYWDHEKGRLKSDV